jgi:manganese transport protein
MEGFLDLRITPWLRRLITRLIAIIPAFFITWIYGESKIGELLVFSQVILSMQLSFAVIPKAIETNPAVLAGYMLEKGCSQQAEALLRSVSTAEVSPKQ